MEDCFVKKYWPEEDIWFYLHFQDGRAVAQVEVFQSDKKFLSLENPVQGDSILYDQLLTDLELETQDFITEEEFEKVWYNR